MQDSIIEALYPSNASINSTFENIEELLSKKITFQVPLPDVPSLALFEESVQVRLEAFAFDVQDVLAHSTQTDTVALQEQLELQALRLRYLINDIRLLHWLKASKHLSEKE